MFFASRQQRKHANGRTVRSRFVPRLGHETSAVSARCTRLAVELLELRDVPSKFTLGTQVQLSDPYPWPGSNPFGGGTPLTVPFQEAEAEPYVAVNPTNPQNMAADWILGGDTGIGVAFTTDGGKSWQQEFPTLTLCAGGGPYGFAVDPGLCFATNGDLYLTCAVFNFVLTNSGKAVNTGAAIAVTKSSDGGLHWSNPTMLPGTVPGGEAPKITGDPLDPHFVYDTYDNDGANGNGAAILFSRTTNAGQSWESSRAIYQPQTSNNQVIGSQIVVEPNGSLVDFFTEVGFTNNNGGSQKQGYLSLIRSTDRGVTWSGPIRVTRMPDTYVTDPETGHAINSASSSFGLTPAVDPHNGHLYVTWEDNRFSGGQYSSIALSVSTDGGLTWSTPIKVNQTPTTIPAGDQQAFLPTVAVADNGTVAVTYYDFRFNDANPGLPTDYWVAHADAGRLGGFSNPANWSQENRLTDHSFNVETAQDFGGPYTLGDYMGLAAAGNDFAAVWSQTDGMDPGNIDFRLIESPLTSKAVEAIAPRIAAGLLSAEGLPVGTGAHRPPKAARQTHFRPPAAHPGHREMARPVTPVAERTPTSIGVPAFSPTAMALGIGELGLDG